MEKQRSGNGHKLLAAGTTSLILEPVLAMAHQGGIGVIVGLAAGAAAYALVDDVEHVTGKSLALPARPVQHTHNERLALASEKKPSLGYRLFVGKSVREERAMENDAPSELEFVPEAPDDAYVPEDILELGDTRPHADSIFSNRLAILGMSGAGKSNLVSVLVEELGQYDAPLLLFDLKGEYVPLCSPAYLNNPRLASARNVTPANAVETGHKIMQHRFHTIVDLSSYSDSDAALVMVGLIEGIEAWQKARANHERIPCTMVLEEAHYWLPENEAHSTIRTVRHPQSGASLLSTVQQVFFHIAKVGRSFGLGLVISTQRPADIDKRVITQAEWRFLLKAMEPADLKVYRTFGLSDEVAQRLDPRRGEAYVIGPDGSRGVSSIRRRYSPDVAKSPGLANIRASRNQGSGTFPSVPRNVPDPSGNEERVRNDEERRERLYRPSYGIVPVPVPVPHSVPEERSHAQHTPSHEERERIIRLAKRGVARREICPMLGRGKAYYDVVKQVLDEEGL